MLERKSDQKLRSKGTALFELCTRGLKVLLNGPEKGLKEPRGNSACYLNRYFLIPSVRIRESSVVPGTPRRAAAPLGP